jgi:succinate-semialdehyde dehydrogenase/glutarate-semialdehyde dehydrogenase
VARVSGLKMGPGMDPSTTLGPLVNSVAVRKVKEHVYDACRLGAKIEIGGGTPDGPGFFHEPTVISSTPLNAAVFREETFGPLAAIFEFATEEDALRIANATESGLAGYFFSNDVRTVLRVAATLEVGMVGINTGKISAVEAPSGGIKESGVGREGSMYGLADYQVIKTITIGNCS